MVRSGAGTNTGMLAAAAALAGCGGGGGSSTQGGGAPGDTGHPNTDLTVDAGTEIVPINLPAAYFAGADETSSFGAMLENGGELSSVGLSLDGGNRIVGRLDEARTVTIIVTVDDGSGDPLVRSFTITAETPAQSGGRPTVDTSLLSGNRNVVVGEAIDAIDVTGGFGDPDEGGDDLIYAVEFSRTGHGLSFDETTNEITGEFSGTENVTAVVTVTNGEGGGSVEHRIIISANEKPVAGNAPLPENMAAVAGLMIAPMDLASAFADPEGTAMTFVVEMADGSDLADSGLMSRDGMIMGAPVSAGVMRIRVTATDAEGASSSREFNITVEEADSPTSGDDLLVNGIRNDVIDGGGGDDTVIYADPRSNYRIWRETPADGGGVRTIVLDKTNAPGTDEGRDTLTGIEILRFGGRSGDDTPVTSLTFDTPAIGLAPTAPTGSTFSTENSFTPIEVDGWFEGGGTRTYSHTVAGGTVAGLSIDSASGRITAAPDTEGVFVITVTASDDAGSGVTYDDVSHSYTLTVEVPQRPPLVTFLAREEDNGFPGVPITPIELRGWFVDGEGDDIIIEVDGLEGTGLSVDRGGVINGTPLELGPVVIVITATDPGGSGASTEHTYTLDVITRPENALFTLQDRTVLTDGPITPIAVDGAFNDPDGGELTFTFEVGSQRGSLDSIGLEYDNSTGLITGTIDDEGSHRITVEASDGNGATREQTFTVTAVEPIPGQENRDPQILIERLRDTGDENETRILPDGAVVFTKGREITPFDIRALFNDPDNDPLTHQAWVGRLGVPDNPSDDGSWGRLDRELGLSLGGGLITGTFSESYSGSGDGRYTDEAFEIVLRVSDEGPDVRYANFGLASDPNRAGSDSVRDWGLIPSFVVHVNSAPALSTSSPLGGIPVEMGAAIREVDVAAGFEDPDTGAELTFSVDGLDGTGLSFANNMISGTFTGFSGTDTRNTLTVTATDEHGIETVAEIELYTNSPPTIVPDAPTPDTFAKNGLEITPIQFAEFFQDDGEALGNELSYQGALIDADGVPIGALSDAGLELNSGTGVLSGTLSRDPEGLRVEVSARDVAGESVSKRIEFAENTRPDFDETVGFPELTVTQYEPIRTPIDLTAAFGDADGHALTYELFIGRIGVEDNPSDRGNWQNLGDRNLEHRDGMLSGTPWPEIEGETGIDHDDDIEIIVLARDSIGEFAVDDRLTDHSRAREDDREVLPAFTVTYNVKPKASATPLRDVEFEFDGMAIAPIDAGGAFTDDDGDDLAFSAMGLGPLEIDRETGEITGTLDSMSILDVMVTADDGHSIFSQNFTITAFGTMMGDETGNVLRGGPEDDTIEGFGGGDIFLGGEGDDTIYGHTATDNGPDSDIDKVVYSGNWNDYFIDGRLVDLDGSMIPQITLRDRDPDNGDDGMDTLVGIEVLEFSDETFTVSAGASAGNDILFGTEGIDGSSLGGGGGNDIIFGFGSADDFGGGNGYDTLVGGDGDDVLNSGPGQQDRIFGGRGNDSIIGDGVGDTALYLGAIYDFKYEMLEGMRMIRITDHSSGGQDGIDEGTDELNGMQWIEYGDGSRIWIGNIRFGIGDGTTQTLSGFFAPDLFYVKGGNFKLNGGGGADTFQFLNSEDSTAAEQTTIMDFSPAEGDRVLLQGNSGMDGFSESDVDTTTESGFTILSHPTSNFQLRVKGTHTDLLDYVLYIGDPVSSAPGSGAAVRMGRKDEIETAEFLDDAWIGPTSDFVDLTDRNASRAVEDMTAGNDGAVSNFHVGADVEPPGLGQDGAGAVDEGGSISMFSGIGETHEFVTNPFEAGGDHVFFN